MIDLIRRLNRARLRKRARRRADRAGESHDYARWVREHDTLDDARRSLLRDRARRLIQRPLISVVMPVHDPEPAWLAEAIESVRAQLYDAWELCIADDRSTDPRVHALLRHYAALDSRIRVTFRDANGHISAASNTALESARGDYIALLDHDDRLAEHSLLCVAETLARFPDAAVLYSDEDKLDANGQRCEPYFKCDWNLELFRGQNLISHLGVYRTDLVRDVGGFRVGYEGSQDYDLALRCIERTRPERIVHIPHVLYHWRIHARSTAQGASAKPYARDAGKRALEAHFARSGIACDVEAGDAGWYRCHYRLPDTPPSVTIIVLDTAGRRALDASLHALRATDYPGIELIVAAPADGDTLPEACNGAIAEARGEVVAIVDSRCTFASRDWLRRMVAHACLPGAGAVGAKLLSRGRVVGNGVLLGAGAGYAPFAQGTQAHRGGYFGRARLAQHIGALGGGCIVVRRQYLRRIGVGWLDPGYRDMGAALVDLTFRFSAYGLHNHWTPLVEATFAEPGWVARRIAAIDAHRVAERWGFAAHRDIHYNANLGLAAGRFWLAKEPRVSLMRPWFEVAL